MTCRQDELKKVLIKNSPVKNKTNLKEQLIKHGFLENKCEWCSIAPEWRGEKMTLEMDHINGDNTDNRLENLRILCLHCHSQTPTFRRAKTNPHEKARRRAKMLKWGGPVVLLGLVILWWYGFFTFVKN